MQQAIMMTTFCNRCPNEAIAHYAFTAGGRYFSVGLCEPCWLAMLLGPDRPAARDDHHDARG